MDSKLQKELIQVLQNGSMNELYNFMCTNVHKLTHKEQLELMDLYNMEYYR